MKRGTLFINVTQDKEKIKRYITYAENEDDIKTFELKDGRSLLGSCLCRKIIPETKNVYICNDYIDNKNIYSFYYKMAGIANRLKYSLRDPRFYIFLNPSIADSLLTDTGATSLVKGLKRYMDFDTIVIMFD